MPAFALAAARFTGRVSASRRTTAAPTPCASSSRGRRSDAAMYPYELPPGLRPHDDDPREDPPVLALIGVCVIGVIFWLAAVTIGLALGRSLGWIGA